MCHLAFYVAVYELSLGPYLFMASPSSTETPPRSLFFVFVFSLSNNTFPWTLESFCLYSDNSLGLLLELVQPFTPEKTVPLLLSTFKFPNNSHTYILPEKIFSTIQPSGVLLRNPVWTLISSALDVPATLETTGPLRMLSHVNTLCFILRQGLCSPGWVWTSHLTGDDLELLTIWCSQCCHTCFFQYWGSNPKLHVLLSKHSMLPTYPCHSTRPYARPRLTSPVLGLGKFECLLLDFAYLVFISDSFLLFLLYVD